MPYSILSFKKSHVLRISTYKFCKFSYKSVKYVRNTQFLYTNLQKNISQIYINYKNQHCRLHSTLFSTVLLLNPYMYIRKLSFEMRSHPHLYIIQQHRIEYYICIYMSLLKAAFSPVHSNTNPKYGFCTDSQKTINTLFFRVFQFKEKILG